MKTRLLCLLPPLLLAVTALRGQQAPSDDFAALRARFGLAARFDRDFPRERVYLHMDQSTYYPGETLFFKAYVVRSSSLRPAPVSRVLHVCLLDMDGSVVERGQFRVDSLGRARGEFALKRTFRPAYYEIKAFTREMLNWTDEAAFSRVFALLPPPREPGRLDETVEMERPESESDLGEGHRRPYPWLGGRAGRAVVEFYPEGGALAAGTAGRVAFRMTDGRGRPLADSLRLYAGDGRPLAGARPEHEGMGLLSLPADAGRAWAEVTRDGRTQRFDLPAPQPGGVTMRVDEAEGPEGCRATLTAGPDLPGRLLTGLMVTCRDRVCHFDTLTLAAGDEVELTLPAGAFRAGVNRIDLIAPDGRELASRLWWQDAEEKRLRLDVRQNDSLYAPFSPAALELRVSDAEGRPVAMNFSLAVYDEDLLPARPGAGIAAELLLGSEVRGYLHRPDYYFAARDAAHRRALDLLLLVQGWRATPAATLCRRDTFRVAEPIEERLTLLGDVLRDNDRLRPYPGVNLTVSLFTRDGGAMQGRTRTDSLGTFKFEFAEDFEGDWIGHISTRDDSGRARWSRVRLRRSFGLGPRALDPREFLLEPYAPPAGAAEPEVFAWPDTIPRTLSANISETVVRPPGGYRGLRGGRYTYRGGERAGLKRTARYINVAAEADRLRDEGRGMTSLFGLLEALDIGFTQNADGLQYRGRRILTLENNDSEAAVRNKAAIGNDTRAWADEPPTADEYKSVILVDNAEDFHRLTGHSLEEYLGPREEGWDREHAVILYSRPDFMYFRQQKGVDKRVIPGYAPRLPFFSPDYRRIDLPDAADHRRTLHWAPDVETDAEGKASAVFFTGARNGTRLRLSAEGVTADGRLLSVGP